MKRWREFEQIKRTRSVNKHISQQRRKLEEYHRIKDLNKIEELRNEEQEYENEKARQQRNRRKLEKIREYQMKKKQTEELLKMGQDPMNQTNSFRK